MHEKWGFRNGKLLVLLSDSSHCLDATLGLSSAPLGFEWRMPCGCAETFLPLNLCPYHNLCLECHPLPLVPSGVQPAFGGSAQLPVAGRGGALLLRVLETHTAPGRCCPSLYLSGVSGFFFPPGSSPSLWVGRATISDLVPTTAPAMALHTVGRWQHPLLPVCSKPRPLPTGET